MGWIDVKKKLPPNNLAVLVVVKQQGQYLVSFDSLEHGYWRRWSDGHGIITHWQYLPTPPEELLK